VSVDELAAANHLESAREIALGQKLWVPRASRVLDVPPPPADPRGSKPTAIAKKEPPPKKPEPPKVVKHEEPPKVAKREDPPKQPAKLAGQGDNKHDADDGEEEETEAPKKESRFIWPVKGMVESPFGARGERQHDGVDIKADKGTPIHAAKDGEVLYSGVQRGYGNIVLVKHDAEYITIYAHNTENKVKVGEHVKQGQVIALVGQTGRATNNHLHFEVRQNRIPKNPLLFLPSE